MTSNEQSNPPPADARVFMLPRSYRWLMGANLVGMSGFTALAIYLMWTQALEPLYLLIAAGPTSFSAARLRSGLFGGFNG